MFLNQEEECLEVDNIWKTIGNDFVVDMGLKCFDDYNEDEESEEDMENDDCIHREQMIESDKNGNVTKVNVKKANKKKVNTKIVKK